MEPAEDRLDDPLVFTQRGPVPLSQWSQPRISWMTWNRMLSDPPAFIVPQWSQPRIGWVTAREI